MKCGDSGLVSVARVMWTYNGDVNWAVGENSKEPSWPRISTDAFFNDVSNKEPLNINKVCSQL